MPISYVEVNKNVLVQSIAVTFQIVEPSPWLARQTLTLKATVNIDGSLYANQTVDFYCVETGTLEAVGYTGLDGVATKAYTMPFNVLPGRPMPCNTWTFKAVHRATNTQSNTVSGKVAYLTRLSIDSPSPVGMNLPFTVSGKLEYESDAGVWSPLTNKTVTIYYDGTSLGSATTQSDGTYSLTVSIPNPGIYGLKAVYAGESLALSLSIL